MHHYYVPLKKVTTTEIILPLTILPSSSVWVRWLDCSCHLGPQGADGWLRVMGQQEGDLSPQCLVKPFTTLEWLLLEVQAFWHMQTNPAPGHHLSDSAFVERTPGEVPTWVLPGATFSWPSFWHSAVSSRVPAHGLKSHFDSTVASQVFLRWKQPPL